MADDTLMVLLVHVIHLKLPPYCFVPLTLVRDGCTSAVREGGRGHLSLFHRIRKIHSLRTANKEELTLGYHVEVLLLGRARCVARPVEVMALADMQVAQLFYMTR
jgi:hypothetical protein